MHLHPIFKSWLEKEVDIETILEKHHSKEQYLEVVFLALLRAFKENELNQKNLLEIDEAIIKGHPDSNVYVLFLCHAMTYFLHYSQLERMKALLLIGSSIINEQSHPMMRAKWLQLKAIVKHFEGKFGEEYRLIDESMSIVDFKSPYYEFIFLNASTSFAFRGQLKGFNTNQLKMLNTYEKRSKALNNTKRKIINNIIICDDKGGNYEIEEYLRHFPLENSDIFKLAQIELKIISGDFNESNYHEIGHKTLVKAFNCILTNDTKEAVKCYNWLINNQMEYFAINSFYDSLYLNIAFLLGKNGDIRQFLKTIKEKGKDHYLDDLFYGRLFLLEKNGEEADEAFVRLMTNINQYGAMGRLIFELQFAREMKLSDILFLTQGWKKEYIKKRKIDEIKEPNLIKKGVDLLLGNSLKIYQVKELIKKYAKLKMPILVTGETGTGKELVARAIHEEGNNSNEPFLAINCGALTDSLLQSELYGYVAGAFTGAQKEHKGIFEAAGKGTVFLDEFGDISPLLQVSLLRVLESSEIRMLGGTINRKIECRIVIATNVDLQKAVIHKKFREDLYFRLTGFEIRLPALCERTEDIPLLMDYFLNKDYEGSENRKKISNELLEKLVSYHWPGNVRELKNEMDRFKILHYEKDFLTIEDFDFTRLKGFVPTITIKEFQAKDIVESEKSNFLKNNLNQSVTSENIVKIIQRESIVTRRLNFMKELFLQHKRLSRKQIIEIINFHPAVATKELQMLCDQGFIIRRTPTTSPRTFYFELVENQPSSS